MLIAEHKHPAMRDTVEVKTGHEAQGFLMNVRTMVIDTYDPTGKIIRRTTWLLNDNQKPPQLVFKGRWPAVRKCFCGAVLGSDQRHVTDHWSREHA